MVERTLEAAPGTSQLGHLLLHPPHDRLRACLPTHWQAAQPKGAGPCRSIGPFGRHSPVAFWELKFFFAYSPRADWKGNYDIQVASVV